MEEQKVIDRLITLLGQPDDKDPGRFARLVKRYLPKLSDEGRRILYEAILRRSDEVIGLGQKVEII